MADVDVSGPAQGEAESVVAAVRAGGERTFAELFERHRRELHVHCYRMLGSFDESEDMVQETFLRAWRAREGFEGRSTFRAWLYRIATNACLDVLERRPRRVLPHHLSPPWSPNEALPPAGDQPWLQPFPNQLLADAASPDPGPDAAAVSKETIELVFLAAIQHLPPRQRAVLILRDVLGWRARETAELLDGTVAATNSALQRARATLREQLPASRADWAAPADPDPQEWELLRRFMTALERTDITVIAELLADDVRATMPPWPMWFAGRDDVVQSLRVSAEANVPGRFRTVVVGANRQPAFASYVCAPGDTTYRAFGISLLRVENGRVLEMTAFHDVPFAPFGLPPVLESA